MNQILLYILLIVFIFFINKFFLNKKILLKYSGNIHQNFIGKDQVPLTGGIIIFIFLFFSFFDSSNFFLFIIFLFFILGILADYNYPEKPIIRFFLQVILILILIINFDLFISSISIDFFDKLLRIKEFNYFFIIFCFIVLINGSNFVDGNNTLSLGYFILIYLSIIYNQFLLPGELSYEFINSFILVLIILFFFNLFNKLYLGDNGIYLLSIITGFTLVKIYGLNQYISPIFIANLLWYPAFEGLFSFIRKIKLKKSPLKADTFHFHQLIYKNLEEKINNKIIRNGVVANIINLYNLILFIIVSQNINNTKFQVMMLLFSILLYSITYFYLYKKRSI